jgi:hypothetical protein
MDMEIDYDIDKKKNIKEVKLFLSILPDKLNDYVESSQRSKEVCSDDSPKKDIPSLHFPVDNTSSERMKFTIFNKQNCLNFYKQNKEILNEVLANTFIIFAVDDDITSYYKAIANFVNICYGADFYNCDSPTVESSDNSVENHERKIFITNFSLIKKFQDENFKKFKVYLIPHKHNNTAHSLFKKLEYIQKFIQDTCMRKEFFSSLVNDFNLMPLVPSEKFLQIRNEFLRTISKKNQGETLKDPISNEIIFPVLNIMVLTYPKEKCKYNRIDEYHVNNIDLKHYESDFIQKFQRHMVNTDITFVAYLDSEEMLCNLNQNLEECPILSDELFANKCLSINFGKIEKIEEMGCAHHNFMDSCPGSLIYGPNFIPIGITTVKDHHLNRHSYANSVGGSQSDVKIQPNSFLPFSNKGVISIFKKFMNIERDFSSFCKDKFFAIEKPVGNCDNFKFINNYLWTGSENQEQMMIDSSTKNVNPVYFNRKISEKSENEINKKKSRNFLILNRRKKYVSDSDKGKSHYKNEFIKEKLINKSFNFAPFNKILEERNNQKISLASFIDETILNLFK